MKGNRSTTSALQEFQRIPLSCPLMEKSRAYNTFFTRYAGSIKDLRTIIPIIANRLSHSPTKNSLVMAIEKDGIPSIIRLTGYVRKLIQLFTAALHDEPSTLAYYSRLIPTLRYLVILSENSHEKMERLLFVLRSSSTMYSEQANGIIAGIVHCLDELNECPVMLEDFPAFIVLLTCHGYKSDAFLQEEE